MKFRLIHADVLDGLRSLADCSVDAVVTDPPYGLEFMGKEWDGADGFRRSLNAADVERLNPFGRASRTSPEYKAGELFQVWTMAWAHEALRVLKPGGHLLAFGGTRTYHRMACGVEDAGFEIRDQIQYLYGSGFPKSLDVSKAIDKAAGHWRGRAGAVTIESQPSKGTEYERSEKGDPVTAAAAALQGWGTALKPAHECIVVARKPLIGTVAANVLEHGTGALNIDACRVQYESDDDKAAAAAAAAAQRSRQVPNRTSAWGMKQGDASLAPFLASQDKGRWPANVVLDDEAAQVLDEQSGELTSGGTPSQRSADKFRNTYGAFKGAAVESGIGSTSGGASRFFYTAKPDRNERDDGLDSMDGRTTDDGRATPADKAYQRGKTARKNHHPTVKPASLMRWLVRLVTPPDGIVLDPFCGSGTTGVAAIGEGFNFIGIEREADYIDIARRRIGNCAPLLATEETEAATIGALEATGAEAARIGLPLAPLTEQPDTEAVD